MALQAAKAFQSLPPANEPFNFVYVSGKGATTDPGRFSAIFARVKGETELALADARRANPLFHASSVRPAIVDAGAHDAVKNYLPQPTIAYRAAYKLLYPARIGLINWWSPTEHLGRFLTDMAMGKYKDQLGATSDIQKVGEFPILENTAFRRIAGLS
jgi:hypothetical protein